MEHLDKLKRESFEHGRKCYIAWQRSDYTASRRKKTPEIDPWLAMKFFLPPEPQGNSKLLISRPHDVGRVAWVQGWKHERSNGQVMKVASYDQQTRTVMTSPLTTGKCTYGHLVQEDTVWYGGPWCVLSSLHGKVVIYGSGSDPNPVWRTDS